jgi:hypothetical protein
LWLSDCDAVCDGALATLAVCVPQALAWTMLADCSDVAVTDVAVINDGLLVASPNKVFN